MKQTKRTQPRPPRRWYQEGGMTSSSGPAFHFHAGNHLIVEAAQAEVRASHRRTPMQAAAKAAARPGARPGTPLRLPPPVWGGRG
jgi:hypothetical protein